MPPRATFRDVFAVREFRALWFSEILSVAGDRLALVALTLLVYHQTRSPLFTALTYAVGYLPWVIGGLFLSDVADRRPRRTVMVTCDAVRAVLVAAMAVPGVPLGALVALLFATTMFTPPFESARAAITPDMLQGERYVLGARYSPSHVRVSCPPTARPAPSAALVPGCAFGYGPYDSPAHGAAAGCALRVSTSAGGS